MLVKALPASHPKSGFEFRSHWESLIWVNLIAMQSGLTAWTPSQAVHGHSHDTDTENMISTQTWIQGGQGQYMDKQIEYIR